MGAPHHPAVASPCPLLLAPALACWLSHEHWLHGAWSMHEGRHGQTLLLSQWQLQLLAAVVATLMLIAPLPAIIRAAHHSA